MREKKLLLIFISLLCLFFFCRHLWKVQNSFILSFRIFNVGQTREVCISIGSSSLFFSLCCGIWTVTFKRFRYINFSKHITGVYCYGTCKKLQLKPCHKVKTVKKKRSTTGLWIHNWIITRDFNTFKSNNKHSINLPKNHHENINTATCCQIHWASSIARMKLNLVNNETEKFAACRFWYAIFSLFVYICWFFFQENCIFSCFVYFAGSKKECIKSYLFRCRYIRQTRWPKSLSFLKFMLSKFVKLWNFASVKDFFVNHVTF